MKCLVLAALALASQAFPGEVHTDFFRGGAFTPVAGAVVAPIDPPSALVIDALPYDRTLACGSYTLTGTSEGADEVTWSVSPGSASGSCSGTDTWSCVVSVSPTSAATATPTVTVTASTSGGSLTATTSLGFFPGTAYSCYLAQNVDGSYNSTLLYAGAVATWQDSTSGNRDLTQVNSSAQPSYRDEVVAGFDQPLVSCDGDDRLAASTAADWTFLHNGSPRTVVVGQATRATNPAINQTIATNKTNTDAGLGWRLLAMDSGINDSARQQVGDNSAGILTTNLAADTVKSGWLNALTDIVDDDTGDDGFLYANDTSSASAAATGAFSSSNGQVLTLCDRSAVGSGSAYTGYLSHFVTYQRVLTSGEIDAAEAVVEWAYGGQPSPIALPTRATRADWGVTISSGEVSSWAMRGLNIGAQALTLCAAGTACPTLTGSGATLGVTFNGTNDFVRTTEPPGFSSTSAHIIVVADPADAAGTYGMINAATYQVGYSSTIGAFATGVDSGGAKTASTAATNGKGVFELRIKDGKIGAAFNGGAFSETIMGALTFVPEFAVGISASFTVYYAYTIHEIAIFPAALPDDNRTAIINDMLDRWDITP